MSCDPGQEYTIKYPPQSVVYAVHRAQEGRLESIFVARFAINQPDGPVIYFDNNNRAWNEDQLCPKSEAVEYAIAYNRRLIDSIDAIS